MECYLQCFVEFYLVLSDTYKYWLIFADASKDTLRVRLRVNTVSSTVVVKNVVGIIYGGTESGIVIGLISHQNINMSVYCIPPYIPFNL